MKAKILTLFCGAILCAAFSTPDASAQERRASINQREHRQQVRIREGVRSGELTRSEALRLEAEQLRIRALERRVKRDGDLDLRERIRLQHQLNGASRHIYRQKHDNQDRDRR